MLQTEGVDTFWAGTRKHHSSSCNRSGKVGVLGEKAISRNDSLCVTLFCDLDDLISLGTKAMSVACKNVVNEGSISHVELKTGESINKRLDVTEIKDTQ